MDIGTAKPTKDDQDQIRHHLLDVVEPDQKFTVADFKRLTLEAIDDICSRGKLPIMVGGSGLYVDSVIFDYEFGKPADAAIREEFSAKSVEELQAICRQNNIELPQNYLNKRYLIRAIELGGIVQQKHKQRANTIVVGLATEREALRARVEQRAEQMVAAGIVQEVANLGAKYGWTSEPMKGNIYRVFRPVVRGELDLQAAVEEFIKSDMRLAKKQMTWFKRNPNIVWGSAPQLKAKIEQFLKAK